MIIKITPDIIVKGLISILLVFFVIAISYLWVQSGNYHFDTDQTHLHNAIQTAP